MGAYAYCQHWPHGQERCGAGMPRPTVAQIVGRDEWCCPYGHANDVTQETIADVVTDLDERVRALEEGLKLFL